MFKFWCLCLGQYGTRLLVIAVLPKILTKEGSKPIEEIEIGDEVLSYNEETGETDYKEVVRLFRNTTLAWCNVTTEDGTELKCTPGHKFYLPDNTENRNAGKQFEHANYAELSEKWVSAEDLKKGDRVLLSDGKYGIVKSVKLEKLDKPETTYNFEVADFHTYYVGANGMLVHNMGAGAGPCGGVEVYDKLDDAIHGDFESQQLMRKRVTNPGVDRQLQQAVPGKWQKMLNNGYLDGAETSIHYFQHVRTGKVAMVHMYDVWSKWTPDYIMVYNFFVD